MEDVIFLERKVLENRSVDSRRWKRRKYIQMLSMAACIPYCMSGYEVSDSLHVAGAIGSRERERQTDSRPRKKNETHLRNYAASISLGRYLYPPTLAFDFFVLYFYAG